MKKTWIAYLLWAVGGFGTLGLHRFYLDSPGMGALYFFTGGLAFVGSLYDIFNMEKLVGRANKKIGYVVERPFVGELPYFLDRDTLNQLFDLANSEQGILSRSDFDSICADDADDYISFLKGRNILQVKVTIDEDIVYYFPHYGTASSVRRIRNI